jgi:hypothetical protein
MESVARYISLDQLPVAVPNANHSESDRILRNAVLVSGGSMTRCGFSRLI